MLRVHLLFVLCCPYLSNDGRAGGGRTMAVLLVVVVVSHGC
jgi:hypothetical protein